MNAHTIAALGVALAAASPALAQQVTNGSLADVNGVVGANGHGTATTMTGVTGTVTTVTAPDALDASRLYLPSSPGVWQQSAVGGGGSVGITTNYSEDANGAAYFAGTGPASKGDLEYSFTQSVALSSLTSMSFDFYRDPASASTYVPVMRLLITKDGHGAGTLVFEYHYQNQTSGPGGVWATQAADLTHGIFWATSAALGPKQAAANGGQKTLAAWLAGNSGANLQVVGVNIGFGSGWPTPFAGAVDHVKYNFAGGLNADWDFAVQNAVPEPASWAMMVGGFGLVGGALRARRRTLRVA